MKIAVVVEIMEWLYGLSPNRANKLEHYAVGGHGVDMFKTHQDLPGMIVTWFADTLKANPRLTTSRSAAPVSREILFLEVIDQPGGINKTTKIYADARQRDPKVVMFSEVVINVSWVTPKAPIVGSSNHPQEPTLTFMLHLMP